MSSRRYSSSSQPNLSEHDSKREHKSPNSRQYRRKKDSIHHSSKALERDKSLQNSLHNKITSKHKLKKTDSLTNKLMKTVAPEKYQKNLRKKEFNDSMIRTEGYIQNSPIPIGIESYDDSGNFINTALEINHVNAKARGSKSICRSNRTKSDHSKSSTGSQVTNSTDVGYSSVGSKSSTSTHGTISTKMTKASSHMNSRANSVLSSKTNSSSSQNSLVIGLDLLPTYSNSNTSSMNHGNNLTANSSSHLPVGHLSSRHSFTRSKSANSSNSHISRMVSKIEMLNNDIKKYKCQKHFEISFNQIKDKFATSHQCYDVEEIDLDDEKAMVDSPCWKIWKISSIVISIVCTLGLILGLVISADNNQPSGYKKINLQNTKSFIQNQTKIIEQDLQHVVKEVKNSFKILSSELSFKPTENSDDAKSVDKIANISKEQRARRETQEDHLLNYLQELAYNRKLMKQQINPIYAPYSSMMEKIQNEKILATQARTTHLENNHFIMSVKPHDKFLNRVKRMGIEDPKQVKTEEDELTELIDKTRMPNTEQIANSPSFVIEQEMAIEI